jgi:hypothetical protein
MGLSSEISQLLTARIEAFTRDAVEPEYLRLHVSHHRVLPILVDWTGFWGLRADGEIWLIDTEDGREPVREFDERLRRVALCKGAKKYPELQPLVPDRPQGAMDCPHCVGTGRIDAPGVPPDTIVCYCGGLGWLV